MSRRTSRKIRPSRGIHFRGKEPSIKTGEMVHWESLLELDYIKLLDFDPEVHSFTHQPLEIQYSYLGRKRRYFPDFKVLTDNNTVRIVEVKPDKYLKKPDNQLKFEVGRRFCKEQGWEYQVVTEQTLHRGFLQENLNLLREVLFLPRPMMTAQKIKEVAQIKAKSTLLEIREACIDVTEEDFIVAAFQLIHFQELYADLINERLGLGSAISMTGRS